MHNDDSTGIGVADWDAVSPREAVEWFANVPVPWWIAGGWAIDLFLGRETRPHGDLDVGVLRRNVGEVLRSFPGSEAFEAKDGALTRLLHRSPRSDVNCLWCRGVGAPRWKLELLLDESEGESWVYRRDPQIRRDLRSVVHHSRDGIPYLAPEVQLLYKAKHARARDERDFAVVLPHLTIEARDWLRQSLVRTLPSHPWTYTLERQCVA
jgi:hypothetical protein